MAQMEGNLSQTVGFNYVCGRIRINHEVLEKLFLPKFIKIMLNADDGRIVIIGSDSYDQSCIKINYSLKSIKRLGVYIYSKLLVEKVYIVAGWNLARAYRIQMSLDSDMGTMAANLKDAIMVTSTSR